MTYRVPDKILEEIRVAQEAGDVDDLQAKQRAAFEAMLAQTGKRMIVVGGMPTDKMPKGKALRALYLNRPPTRRELRARAQPPAMPPAAETDLVIKSETPGRPDVVVKRRRSGFVALEGAAKPIKASRDKPENAPKPAGQRPSNGKPISTEADTIPETPASKSGQRPTKKR
jgi:hypothetical protein